MTRTARRLLPLITLGLTFAHGCGDSNNGLTGAGTGGSGAGAASDAPSVISPIGGTTGTKADGTPTDAGRGNTDDTPAKPAETSGKTNR